MTGLLTRIKAIGSFALLGRVPAAGLKVIVRCLAAGALVLPLSGCFTAMSHFMGHSPSASEALTAGALDVVTLPVQVAVIVPLMILDVIDENTGECRRMKQLAKERTELSQKLKADFSLIYADPDYLSPTNTLKREAVGEYFQHYGYKSLTADDAQRLAGIAASRHELAETLGPIWRRDDIPLPVRMKAVSEIEANGASHEHPATLIREILYHADLPDGELERLVTARESCPASGGAAASILECRRQKRESDARLEAEKRAWQEKLRAKEREERRRQCEIRHAEMMRHNAEMRRIVKNIWNEDFSFAEVVENINDDIVRRSFRRALEDVDRPIPEANLKAVVDAAMKSKRNDENMLSLVLYRSELSAETLRELYPGLVDFLSSHPGDSWASFMGGYIANPNLPEDILRKAWREPQLVGARKTYFDHCVRFNLDEGERRRISDEEDALYKEYARKQDGRRELNRRLHGLMKAHLPKDPPEGWKTSMAPRTVRKVQNPAIRNVEGTKGASR